MGLNKVINKLTGLFDGENYKNKQLNAIRKLLKKLNKKAIKFKEQLNNEKDDKKSKEIKLKLQVIRAQLKKGNEILKK